jgi:hypothetical protein
MAYIDTNLDIWKVDMFFVYPNEQTQQSGVQMEILSAGNGDSRLTLAGTIDSLVVAHLAAYLSEQTKYIGCRVAAARGRMPWSSVNTKMTQMGTDIGPSLPTQVRLHTTWRTDFVGVKYRGRTYWPTPGRSAQDATNGGPTIGFVAACNVIADTIRAGFNVGGTTWAPCVHHKVAAGDPAQYMHTITAQRTNNKWSTQRRSGDYGKPNIPPW